MEPFWKNNQLFHSLKDKDIEKFIACANPRIESFSTGEIILYQGDSLTHLLLILEGSLEMYKEDFEGNRSIVGTLLTGESYGEQKLFAKDGESAFTLVAMGSVKIMLIPRELFSRPCSKVCPVHQGLIQNMLSLLSNQAGILEKKIAFLTAKGLRRKIALYLLEIYEKNGKEPVITVDFNREEMAEYFDVQRPSLSRELIAMKKQGLLEMQRNTFKILELDKLREIAK